MLFCLTDILIYVSYTLATTVYQSPNLRALRFAETNEPHKTISLFGIPVAHAPIRRISLPGYRSGGINAVYALNVTEHFLSRNTLRRMYWVFLSSFIK
jgi:hypothetical protein